MSLLDYIIGRPAGYTADDRPIFAATDEQRCGDAHVVGAPGMGAWSCLLRRGHAGGCWYSNPAWPPHYSTATERDAAMKATEERELR